MILYDQNYNFIGASNETISFLGYEDIHDFTAQHSDFTSLLVQKEGYIYDFKNFSWLDFILYSGAPNKAAILKLKNGQEIEIKLTVKEVFLPKEIDGINKFYGVRIISDEFVTIASKVDPNIKSENPKNNFSLNSMIETEVKNDKKFDESSTLNEPTKEISLNFLKNSNDINMDSWSKKDKKVTEVEEVEEQVIPLFGSYSNDNDETHSFNKVTKEDSDIAVTPHLSINEFQNESSGDEQNNIKPAKKEQDTKSGINLNFLKINQSTKDGKTDNQPSTDATLETSGTLKHNDEESENEWILKIKKEEDLDKSNSDDILTTQEKFDNIQEKENQSKMQATPFIKTEENKVDTNFFNTLNKADISDDELKDKSKDEIINQIKTDLAQIDTKKQNHKDKDIEKHSNKFDSLNSDISTKQTENELNNDFLLNKDVLEEKEHNDAHQSFANTLNSIFDQVPNSSAKEKESSSMEDEQKKIDTVDNELLENFIQDYKRDIKLFRELIHKDEFIKSNYPISRIKSSADILELNDIISLLNKISTASKEMDKDKVEELADKLSMQVSKLQSGVEGVAIL